LSDWIGTIREVIGPEVPLASDHYGHIDVNSCIRLARAMEKHHLAWMEDMVPWQFGTLMKQIKDATDIPILTGEDIFLKEDFAKLVEMGAVDMIHPDLASAGGILETKKIGDHAMEHGVAMAMHFAGSPVSFMANLHCASATENFVALEHHSVDIPWWEDLVTGPEKPINQRGFATPPDRPGLGIELDEDRAGGVERVQRVGAGAAGEARDASPPKRWPQADAGRQQQHLAVDEDLDVHRVHGAPDGAAHSGDGAPAPHAGRSGRQYEPGFARHRRGRRRRGGHQHALSLAERARLPARP
jgi:hypothetical protein